MGCRRETSDGSMVIARDIAIDMEDVPTATPSQRIPPRVLPDTGGFLHPEQTVALFGLRPGMIVADFGAGGGYFTIPMARVVGAEGKVFAIDVQQPTLAVVKSKANLERLLHVETVWADLELPQGSHLPEASVDLVMVANILFQAEAKEAIIAEARRVLRSGGDLIIIEWDETPFPAGPPQVLRVPKRAARQLAEREGFRFDREFAAGSHHYGLSFKK